MCCHLEKIKIIIDGEIVPIAFLKARKKSQQSITGCVNGKKIEYKSHALILIYRVYYMQPV